MDLKKRFLMNYKKEEESTARLPKEYQELEYIESTGTQYIKSGVVFTLDDSGEIEADISITTTNDVALFGSVGSYYSPTIISRENSASYWFSTGSQDVYSPITKNVKHNIKMVGASGTTNWYVDSTNVSTTTYTTSTANSLEMYIFAMNFSNIPYSNASMQLYKFNVKKNGVLVRNFVPCYRKADYEAGLYDLVNDVFYTNQGTGYFTMGDNVYYLPKAYQEVQYIESSGTQYIDTGVNASTDYGKRFNVKLSVNSFDTGLVIGAGKPISGNSRWFAPLGVSHDARGNLFSMYNGGSYYSTTTNFTTNTIYETESLMQSSHQELKVNGTGEILISTGTWDMGLNLYLFAQNYNGTASAFSSIKLYSCKFYENLGGFHLQNDFRPCYRKIDGEIGLYDCVNDVFYTNQGTGSFAKGENNYDIIG